MIKNERFLSLDTLFDYFSYEKETGLLRWVKRPSNRVKLGEIAGTKSISTGYYRVRLKGYLIHCHRIVWAMNTGNWPDGILDHVNGDRALNTLENLRVASFSQNVVNAGVRSNSLTKIKGISMNPRKTRYIAILNKEGVRVLCQYCRTLEEAREARRKAVLEHYGAFEPAADRIAFAKVPLKAIHLQ